MSGRGVSAAIHPDWLVPDWELPASWPQVRAFMTTRAGGVSQGRHASMNVGRAVEDDPAAVAANRAHVDEVLGAPAVFLHQIHGADVLELAPMHLQGERPKADASFSTIRGLGCAIQVADCLPVLFVAPGVVGGAHAGWRGLAAGVLENTVHEISRAAGCEASELRAWLGPCIGPQRFEVGAEVLVACGADPASPDPAFFTYRTNERGEDRWLANLPALARQRLQEAGLSHISGGRWCTLSEPSRFFSFRHEPLAGRMVGAITLV
ncbi:peptidoglycan editing factor PgeF [Pelomonas sp. SE-A7]|uniref:peptidoglycan editing factor PgeF n=1 Tax=Pelomonas sp. SE-A7 TaxID=3054953 RepID=UPI00259D2B78|nr:peptidoglycan editing factor PgeF [Pelomonas sp. SE-A7]MDM4766092.1 peptidoglycan editing factor PgeF [Pelomonas sp. SE-A7]